jgi:hypothetical protein
VHRAMHPVMPGVLDDEKYRDLVGHLEQAREGNRGLEAKVLAHRVEHPDLGKFDCEVGEEDEKGALCLLPGGGDLVLWSVSIC